MVKLVLIRHGETDYSLQNKYCGFSDPPLNNKGIWQAEKLANKLKGLEVDRVYSSDLKRAYETAQIVFKNKPIKKISEFRELNFGIFEGLNYEEIIKKHPKLYRNWINNPPKIKIPNGESLQDLSKRVKRKLFFILSQFKDGAIGIVAHGGPIRIILCDVLKFGLDAFWQIEQDSGALNIIDYSESLPPIVVKMNDTSHLVTPEEAIV